jgi:3-hydroxyacyl-[acyl-carrier-protein] dehydratase
MRRMRFLLIDRITLWEPGIRGSAVKNIALSEDFFEDHFPLKPIMPGVLILEGMAQLSGLLLEEGVRRESGKNIKALVSIIEKVRFRSPVYPGETLEYTSEVKMVNELGGKVAAKALLKGELVAEAEFIFSFHEIDNPRLESRRSEVLSFWLKGLQENGKR